MKKNHIREYTTEAFRFYARTGSAEKYKQELWDEARNATNKTAAVGQPKPAGLNLNDQVPGTFNYIY